MKIKLDIAKGSSAVDNVVAQLRQYKEDLRVKNELFVERLAEIGCDLVNESLSYVSSVVPHEEDIGTAVAITDATGDTVKMRVHVASHMILFVEFGTGVRNKEPKHPKAAEMGFGPGTYPGKGHWNDPYGWYYMGKDGKTHHTYGIPAQMPMYKSAVELQSKILDIAREVFHD